MGSNTKSVSMNSGQVIAWFRSPFRKLVVVLVTIPPAIHGSSYHSSSQSKNCRSVQMCGVPCLPIRFAGVWLCSFQRSCCHGIVLTGCFSFLFQIPVLADLPVGDNLQDHLMMYPYFYEIQEPLACTGDQAESLSELLKYLIFRKGMSQKTQARVPTNKTFFCVLFLETSRHTVTETNNSF